MRLLRNLEDLVERTFEGGFNRVFRARVQPAEIATKLERSMEGNKTIGVGKVFAPNTYEAALNPRDHEAFERYLVSLERELSSYLNERARELGLTLITRPKVKLVASPNVRPGSVQVQSWLQDLESVESENQVEFTQPIEILRQRAKPRDIQSASLTVVAGRKNGERYQLPPGRVRLGRGTENQVVLDDSRVSRQHAEIFLRGSEWYLRDLGSTNGTYVNGYGIRERALESGDRVSLGGVELVFHSRR